MALPQGAQVKGGDAKISSGNNLLHVTAGDSSIIEWDSFSIDAHERAAFILPNDQSSVLNRVTGTNLSEIFGSLESNGHLFLINPQGILIGKSGVIEAASFIGSSLNLSDEYFLAKGPLFFEGSETSVVNEGTIRTTKGHAILVGAELINRGEIEALQGMAALCEGDQVYIHLVPNEPLWFRIQAKERGSLLNEGTIRAADIELHGRSISHSGTAEAGRAVERDGRIYLVAEESIDVSGSISAPAGEIRVLGEEIRLAASTQIDASGPLRGGTVLIGGDFKGSNPEIPNAKNTRVEEGAEIKADALISGDGGKVIVWADDTTIFQGHISAQALGDSGDGGFAEMSGSAHLFVSGLADLRAKNGKFGTAYFDPIDVLIQNGGGGTGPAVFDDGLIAIQLGTASVFITTPPGAGAGTITVNNDVNISWATTSILSLVADRNIIFNGGGVGGTFNNTTDGSIVLQANGVGAGAYHGVDLNNAKLTSGGSISVTGTGGSGGSNNAGIMLQGGALLTATGSGTISLTGTGGAGLNDNVGVFFNGGGTLAAVDGNITVMGTGVGTGMNNHGVDLNTLDPFDKTGTIGTITVNGEGGSGSSANSGIIIQNTISNGATNLTMTGTAGGMGPSDGIHFSNPIIQSNGAGTITFNGNGSTTGVPGDLSQGLRIQGATIDTTAGDLFINGTGTNSGIGVTMTSVILNSMGTADISVTGIGGTGNSGAGLSIGGGKGGSSVSNVDGDITLTGHGNGTGGATSFGVTLSDSYTITGMGALSITGTGSAAGTIGNLGIQLTGTFSTNTGNILMNGTGGGPTVGGHGVASSPPVSITSTSGNIQITGASGPGTDNSAGITLDSMLISTSGNIILNGTSFGTGLNCQGIYAQTVFPTIIQTMGAGTISLTGVAGVSSTAGAGIEVTGTIQTINGAISMTGSGSNTGGSQGILLNGTFQSTGTGSISLLSNNNDIEIAPTSTLLATNSDFMSILAVTGASNIILDSMINCGGDFIAAANNDFTLQATGALSVLNAGRCTIIVDQQMPNGVGPGQFINNGTITVPAPPNDNLAIYASSGPMEPPPGPPLPGVPPNQVTLGTLGALSTWDTGIVPDRLASKYYTYWSTGGPYHGGPGFGSFYTPGTGVFGSQVIWYKFPFPIVPPVPPTPPTPFTPEQIAEIIAATPFVFQQLWANAQVNPNYFFYPYEFCRGFPCIWMNESNEL